MMAKQYGIKMKSYWEHIWELIGNRPKTNKFPPPLHPPQKPNDKGMNSGVYINEPIMYPKVDPVHMVR